MARISDYEQVEFGFDVEAAIRKAEVDLQEPIAEAIEALAAPKPKSQRLTKSDGTCEEIVPQFPSEHIALRKW